MSKRKPTNRAPRRIDWPAIEAAYLDGQVVRTIAERHGVNSSTIYRRALRDKWTSARPPERPTLRLSREAAALPGDELAQLRSLAAKLSERLEHHIDGHRAFGGKIMGAGESPAGLLLKLCQITEKIISIERQLGGADAPTPAQLNEQDREILDRFKRRFRVG